MHECPFPEPAACRARCVGYHSGMIRTIICVCLIMLTSGCMAVLGYEPTPSELEAIRRGEDPRATEAEIRERNAGESSESTSTERDPVFAARSDDPAPLEGTVLRWMDSATVVIESGDRRETVALPGIEPSEDFGEEQRLLDDRMNRWTYGSNVRLSYPVKDDKGEVVYRDSQGRLLATIN